MTARAVVIGAGWAGEGHTTALRNAATDVVALCGRTPEPTRATAQRLGIQDVRLNWREAIADVHPDVVSIATTARSHCDIAVAAAEAGCHVVCDKPLATNAAQAGKMFEAVANSEVKHAYAATGRYAPAVAHAATLLRRGAIGELQEIESVVHFGVSPRAPHLWFHELDEGGGILNNVFTHVLAQILYLTGGRIHSATGWARQAIDRVPVTDKIHDFRAWSTSAVPPGAETAERLVDADMISTVLARMVMPDGNWVSVTFHASCLAVPRETSDYLGLFGADGALRLEGSFNFPDRIHRYQREADIWETVSMTDHAGVEAFSNDPVQSGWNQLFADFITDVETNDYLGYPTFADGLLANQVIDSVRREGGWTSVQPVQPQARGPQVLT